MTDNEPPFLWYYALGRDACHFEGGFATCDEATSVGLTAALGDFDHITIIEARHDKVNADVFSADDVLDDLTELNDDLTDEDGDIGAENASSRQKRDLEATLRAALQGWLDANGFDRAVALSEIRNELVIGVPQSSGDNPN